MRTLLRLIPLFLLLSCDSMDPDTSSLDLDCSHFHQALIEKDSDEVSMAINELARDLEPEPVDLDGLGHLQNLMTLVDRIATQCPDITAEIICYACIQTLPAQSEISLKLDSAGVLVERVVDILTPAHDVLTFRALHDD